MTDWLPGVRRVPGPHAGGGDMVGGPPRVVHHTTENPPGQGAFDWLDGYLVQIGYEPHLLIDPVTGDICQFLPLDRSAYALEHPAGTGETNRLGSYCVQIEWVGQAVRPFTSAPGAVHRVWSDLVLPALDDLGIPQEWPAGSPLASPGCYGPNRSRSESDWTSRAGHYAHSQVPHNHHSDCGAIDVDVLLPQKGATIMQRPVLLRAPSGHIAQMDETGVHYLTPAEFYLRHLKGFLSGDVEVVGVSETDLARMLKASGSEVPA